MSGESCARTGKVLPLVALSILWISCVATDVYRNCLHGSVMTDGTCRCLSCWTGPSCSRYASRPPTFARNFDTAALPLPNDDLDWKIIYRAEASDPDQELCQENSGCPCSKTKYFIVGQDQASNFRINQDSGDVSIYGDSHSVYSEYQLILGATDDGSEYDTMTLIVSSDHRPESQASASKYLLDTTGDLAQLGYSSNRDGQPLSRHKRSVTLPTNLTFTLSKYGANTNLTEIKVGVRILFRLDMLFPNGSTDIQVELFAPDSDSIVMMLCNVQVVVGKNLGVSGQTIAQMESQDNSLYNDRAVIKLGTVTNSGKDLTSEAPSTLTVTYEAVMIQGNNTANKQEYWVSAGAEYNSQNDVWVGQTSFQANTIDDSQTFADPPTVAVTGPSSLPVGSCGTYTFSLTLNRPLAELKFDLFAPSNDTDVMCVCTAKVLSASSAYQCGIKDQLDDYQPTLTAGTNTEGFSHVTIDLGRTLNKLAREYKTNSNSSYEGVLTFGVQLCMNNRPDLVSKTYVLGSSIQLSNKNIWTGSTSVRADPKQTSQVVTPIFYMTFPSGQVISRSRPAFIDISMEIKENSIADYLLQVVAPTGQGNAIFQVCSITILSAGDNLACLGQRKLQVLHSMTSNTSIYPDMASVNLGPIHNQGTLGTVPPGSSNVRNTVIFRIAFKATDHPEASVGSTHNVSFGMFVGIQKVSIGSTTLTVVADTATVNVTGSSMPQLNLSLVADGNGRLAVGMTGQLFLDIRTARNVSYSPFNVEFIMPNISHEPLIKICKVKLQSVGANNPCVVAEAVERSVQMISSYSPIVTDRAVINIDSLCNIQVKDDESEDHFVLAASVMLTNSQQLQTSPSTHIDAGITYNQLAVNVLKLDIQTSTAYSPVTLSTAPYVAVIPNNGNMTSIPWGAPFRYLVRIKTAPNDSTPLSLSVNTQDDAISVCDLRFVRAGEAYPCLEPPIGVLINQDPSLGINRGGNVDLKVITNVGSDPPSLDDNWDSNTIELELVAKITLDSALAADGSIHTLNLVVSYNSGYTSQVTATVTVTAASDTAIVDVPWVTGANISGSMKVASITGQETPPSSETLDVVVPSESKRIVISMDTIPGTTSNLSVAVTTPANVNDVLEILYIGLLYAGDNLPCVKSGQSRVKYESRSGSGPSAEMATLSLGFVCNTGSVTNDTTGTANTIKIECVVRLLASAKSSPASPVQVEATVVINGQQLVLNSVSLTVGDPETFNDVFRTALSQTARVDYNSTDEPIVVAISEVRTFPIVVTVPPFSSSKVSLDVVTPVSSSAIMTVVGVQVVRSGKNLPKLELCVDDFVVTSWSQYNTSQVTKYEVQLGVVSNAGISYTDGRNITSPSDDTISMDVTLQMADNPDAVNQAMYNVSVGVRVTKFVFVLDVKVTVNRTGKEGLVYNISAEVDQASSTANTAQIDIIYQLSNRSTAEGQNAILVLSLPVYVTHLSTVITSPYKTITNVAVHDNMVILSFDTLFFTDEIHLTTVLASNNSYSVPQGVTGQESILSIQPVADTNTITDYADATSYINFSIATTTKTTSQCVLSPLGMESGLIQDCQISSSPDSIQDHGPTQGRYNKGTGWSPFVHTGTANQERYFQVFFGSQVVVSRLKLQQDGPSFAVSLSLSYSNDGLAWIGSSSQISPISNVDQVIIVPSPHASRYLRVMITAMDNERQKGSFRFEFIGCVAVNDGPTDLCSAVVSDNSPLPEFAQRTFLRARSTLYVSVGIKGSKGIEQKSFATSDDQTWRELDSRVGCIIGYEPTEDRLYGISTSGDSYLCSLDGDVWYTVPPAEFALAKTTFNYQMAVTVPVDVNLLLNSSTPDPTFTYSQYGATMDGILVNNGGWKPIFTWAKCS